MNTYKITAVVNDTGREITDRVTEANEVSAKKCFREIYRHSGQYTITNVEIINDVPASKQQERDAIEKIRAILETLGTMSYTGTALEGCLEIAEENIENDFASSMKQRAESAEKKAAHFQSSANSLSAELEKATAKIAELQQQIEAMQEKVISGDDIHDCIQLANEKMFDSENAMKDAAESIVAFADQPESEAFKQAVGLHRSNKSDFDYYAGLISRLSHIK